MHRDSRLLFLNEMTRTALRNAISVEYDCMYVFRITVWELVYCFFFLKTFFK